MDSPGYLPLSKPPARRAGAIGNALPGLVSRSDRVLSRNGVPVPEQPDQQRAGYEPTDVRPERDSAHVRCAQCGDSAEELQSEPDPDHQPGGHEDHLAVVAKEDE